MKSWENISVLMINSADFEYLESDSFSDSNSPSDRRDTVSAGPIEFSDSERKCVVAHNSKRDAGLCGIPNLEVRRNWELRRNSKKTRVKHIKFVSRGDSNRPNRTENQVLYKWWATTTLRAVRDRTSIGFFNTADVRHVENPTYVEEYAKGVKSLCYMLWIWRVSSQKPDFDRK